MNGSSGANTNLDNGNNVPISISPPATAPVPQQSGQPGSRTIGPGVSSPPSPVSPVSQAQPPVGRTSSVESISTAATSVRTASPQPAPSPSASTVASAQATNAPAVIGTPRWLPWTMRWYLLSVPVATSLILCIAISVLCWYSQTHYGLGKDDDTSSLLFGWRFTPTLIAVLYCQLTVMLFEDVKRTEPYAHMARSGGASALSTVLSAPGSWWKSLFDGFGRKKTGTPRSWVLICTTLAYIIGLLAISPLSSSMLTSDEVAVKRDGDFVFMDSPAGKSLTLIPTRDTYFRSIGNYLQNVTTSTWIDDSYYVHPFWPADMGITPLGTKLTSTPGTWTGTTSVFSAALDCESLHLIDKEWKYVPAYTEAFEAGDTEELGNLSTHWIHMESPSGCKYGLAVGESNDDSYGGGIYWDSFKNLEATNYLALRNLIYTQHNLSAECQDSEVMVIHTPFVEGLLNMSMLFDGTGRPFPDNFTATGQICKSRYYTARMPVTITTSPAASSMRIDPEVFRQRRQLVPFELINTDRLQTLSSSSDWNGYMRVTNGVRRNNFWSTGPATILAGRYNFKVWEMVKSQTIVEDALRLKQRFMGELLQNSILQPDAAERQRARAQVSVLERRVVVIDEVGVLLAVLFFISFLLLALTLWLSRLHRRPLHLFVDPITPLGMAALVASKRDALTSLQPLDQASKKDRKVALRDKGYATAPGTFDETQCLLPGRGNKAIKKTKMDWRPAAMHLKTLTGLFIFLLCLIVGLAVLDHFAGLSKLYQTAFVYEANIPIFNKSISTIAPYSIVPTILAVLVGLWWDSLDKHFRLLQPYLSMSKKTPSLAKGAGLQYQTSYWVWAAFRAARNKHWLLLIVTFGSTLSQVFIVSMSALFEREAGNVFRTLTANRTLELRQVPQLDEVTSSALTPHGLSGAVLEQALVSTSSYWMYTATVQLILNGSEPAWSRDGWSFVPVDLSEFSTITAESFQRIGDKGDDDDQLEALIANRNVSISTSAIRARVECSQTPAVANVSSWLYTWDDMNNKTFWNVTQNPKDLDTAYSLYGVMFQDGQSYNTSVLTHPAYAYCCGNSSAASNESSHSALGYWSANNGLAYPFEETVWPHNFTSKWIYGLARTDYYKPGDNTSQTGEIIFPEVPSLQALNCKPIIEGALADITLDQETGQVLSYSVGTPLPAEQAWSEAFVMRQDNQSEGISLMANLTTSYGVKFLGALLGAAHLLDIGGVENTYRYRFYNEDLLMGRVQDGVFDDTFVVRDQVNGLNLDFPSYAMYNLVNRDPTALLDQETLLNLTQRTFSTYFQHFVSTGWDVQNGGFAYQRIGEKLDSRAEAPWQYTGPAIKPYPELNTNRTAVARVSNRIEVLKMNAVATWLSIGILIWLALTTLIIAALQRTYLSSVIRNFESPADLLVAIASSENLLNLVQQHDLRKFDGLRKSRDVEARLGWFRDSTGSKKWGVEIVGSVGGAEEVQWIDWPEFAPLRTATTVSSRRFEMLKKRTKSFGLG
ncbi:hypothetical protein BDV96DRAFT_594294 [Lophiotrema nucula]|uniref:Uncharacterized protein n=1 Tax=Lophiotrema nucula TaxID=690887 RepID=A0A6A5ZUC1_9PLEO|nr:hypothetical protein BDV96DRAFT_594294 [Lophiotrema nucula]